MGKFLDGFFAGAIVVFAGTFLYLYFGFVNLRADTPNDTVGALVATPSLEAAVSRLAPPVWDPIQPDGPDLLAGMTIYQIHCSSCHGDIAHPRASFADSLMPRPQQFLEDRADLPDNENFYIILHGIRWSGMPAWNHKLSEKQIWQVTTFLTQMHNLPRQVSNRWKAAAAASSAMR